MNTKAQNHTDIKTGGVIDRFLPASAQPYAYLMRLDRPIGWWLLLLPGLWAIALASGGITQMDVHAWSLMGLFFIGAIVMRGAGCVINDLWDRDIDKLVERTAARPLASGLISPRQGLAFLAALLFCGGTVLINMNWATIVLGLGVMPLIVLYPLMKRITYWPQAFLGITFNFGVLMGWSAVNGMLPFEAFLLYLGCILWTLGYDTIYAHQDKEDDALAGVKSTALKFGHMAQIWVGGFYIFAMKFIALAILSAKGTGYAPSLLLIVPAAHLIWQLYKWDKDDPENALKIFKSNRDFGILVLILCLL